MPEAKLKREGPDQDLQKLAQELLSGVREDQEVGPLISALALYDPGELKSALQGDDAKKAFWANIYNAFTLHFMRSDPTIGESRSRRMKHFFERKMVIGGKKLSFQDIEHRILRRGMLWWGLGYLRKPWASAYERAMRVDRLDPRIHFALNCGAKSCPPIRFYTESGIDAELDLATKGFMMTEVSFDPENMPGILEVSSIFRLYQGDFGGKAGTLKWIRKYREDIPEGRYRIRFAAYDWTTDLNHFA